MSIESLDPQLANRIAGTDSYNLTRVLENAESIARNTGIDLLIGLCGFPE